MCWPGEIPVQVWMRRIRNDRKPGKDYLRGAPWSRKASVIQNSCWLSPNRKRKDREPWRLQKRNSQKRSLCKRTQTATEAPGKLSRRFVQRSLRNTWWILVSDFKTLLPCSNGYRNGAAGYCFPGKHTDTQRSWSNLNFVFATRPSNYPKVVVVTEDTEHGSDQRHWQSFGLLCWLYKRLYWTFIPERNDQHLPPSRRRSHVQQRKLLYNYPKARYWTAICLQPTSPRNG